VDQSEQPESSTAYRGVRSLLAGGPYTAVALVSGVNTPTHADTSPLFSTTRPGNQGRVAQLALERCRDRDEVAALYLIRLAVSFPTESS
jgi:hypothetical protein